MVSGDGWPVGSLEVRGDRRVAVLVFEGSATTKPTPSQKCSVASLRIYWRAQNQSAVNLNSKSQSSYSVQDYKSRPRIEGIEIVDLKRFNDDGGAITELARLGEGIHAQLPGFVVRQVNYSEVEAGAIKAFHLHRRQTDVWYVPPGDKLLLVLHDCRQGSPTEGQTMRFILGDGNNRLVRIPPGVAHGCANISAQKGVILYFVDVQFSTGADCDEGRLPWDFLGSEVWNVVRG
ncbi:MAG: dTDP-4-dehydrorhamnose 3,5-epimerase family protein [Planctomycetes bacterium]|nr:dTDP-4-dehydrorhamnose 3,5-epimerase family protein [Planctomycetota bacterium]